MTETLTKVTRDVIEDLLPLYVAGEASRGTRTLVEAVLKRDPDLARLASAMASSLPARANSESARRRCGDAIDAANQEHADLEVLAVGLGDLLHPAACFPCLELGARPSLGRDQQSSAVARNVVLRGCSPRRAGSATSRYAADLPDSKSL